MVDIKSIKAQIRSVLLSLGKTATEQEFRKAYYEIEGANFNEVLRQLNINFHDLFLRIPDVAKIVYAHNQVFIQRVSNEATAHMENLTVQKYSKNYRGPKLVTKSGAIKGRPMTNPLSVKAPVYNPYPMYTAPQRKVFSFQQNRSYGYQKPVQNNFNMKVSVGTNNNNNGNRNVQCYFANNASYNRPQTSSGMSTSTYNTYNRPQTSQMPTSSKQAFDFGNISSTSTKKDLSIKEQPKSPELPRSSSVASLNNLSKTSRMPPAPPSDISSISSSDSTVDDNFEDATFDQSSVKSEYDSALDETLKASKRILTESPRIAPMASTTRPTVRPRESPKLGVLTTNLQESPKLDASTTKPQESPKLDASATTPQESPKLGVSTTKSQVTSLLKTSKPEEAKNSSKLDSLADHVGTLRLDDKENVLAQHSSPIMARQRLRSMRIFREALNAINTNPEVSSQSTASLFDPREIITLPEAIQNEEEMFFFMKIIDVASPGKFVFQFSFEKLKNLCMKMNDFYNSIQDMKMYQIKDLDVDNIVAIRSNDLWYRGQVKSFNGTEANIQLVDSMKIHPQKVLNRNIFHLHQKFTIDSPKSAFGKLHGLKPLDSEWSMLSKAKLDSIHDKILLATVKCIDNGVYSLSIIAETQNFTRLSDMFIEENLAGIELDDLATEAVFRSLV